MQVLVDDTLALLANLDAIELPREIERPIFTVYAFQIRLANALAVSRPTTGRLQQLYAAHPPLTDDVDTVLGQTEAVAIIDPTRHAPAIARAKARWGSLVAEEVVAIAKARAVAVRLSAGNAHGQISKALEAERILFATWELYDDGDRFGVRDPS